jgi:YbbR domain-containing protein
MAALLKKIFVENKALKFFSLLLAISLWFFVMGEREAEFSFSEVPLVLLNKSDDLIITTQTADSVSLRVRGSRGILATLSSSSIKAMINLEGVRAGTTTFRNLVDKVKLPNGVKVTAISPADLSVTVEPLVTKIVPVQLTTKGILKEGYEISRISVTPEFVEVRLAKSEADELEKVVTEPLDISGFASDINREVTLVLTGVAPPRTINLEKVSAFLIISEKVIETILSDIKVEVFNSSYRADIVPSTVQLVVKGPYHLVKDVSGGKVKVLIDLAGVVPGSYSKKAQITLPEQVTLVAATPLWFKVVVRRELVSMREP